VACDHRGVNITRRIGITSSDVTMAAKLGKQAISTHPELLVILTA